MHTKIIEVTNGPRNWGKFMLARFDANEWARRPAAPGCDSGRPLLGTIGWSSDALWVLDLQTGEGALFRPGGAASADLNKHRVWVCPMFEPFLTWLYLQPLDDLTRLPDYLDLPDAPFQLAGHRRTGGRP